jgi:hypothetical protein
MSHHAQRRVASGAAAADFIAETRCGRGGGQKLWLARRRVGLRKFCEKILDPPNAEPEACASNHRGGGLS